MQKIPYVIVIVLKSSKNRKFIGDFKTFFVLLHT